MTKQAKTFDRRVVDRNVRDGVISPDDYEKYLKSLPDAKNKAAFASVESLAPRGYMKGALGIDQGQETAEE